ncbi:Vesicle-fusing ATPase [Portunus trituberculatus]|uniref:Vesicle-fusing ATPase n=1 Tax=Portunus trituberculatus TaxID=210409 RepID=A0A5B7GUR2_PORTR|nr:Vesicle-fusing ATPase [Portunus trituberculatus]
MSLNCWYNALARSSHTSLFSADWDFHKMGIGGLDEEFIHILRRAFASRVFPPEVTEQLGVNHVKGLLLYGPPGLGMRTGIRYTGRTVILVLPVIQYQNSTVVAVRREMTELSI